MLKLPVLQPLPLKTQGSSFTKKLYQLLIAQRQWLVTQDWHYRLPNNQRIIIPKGFIFSGRSFPRLLWLFCSPTGLLLIPAILLDFSFKHDYLLCELNGKQIKFKEHSGFFYWCRFVRDVGRKQNQLYFIDSIVWLITLLLSWPTWLANRRDKANQ